MSIQPRISHSASKTTFDEHILVVPRDILFAQGSWQGVQQTNIESYIDTIIHHQQFLPRSLMEQDPTYKQVIPYMIFTYNHHYFVMQRTPTASEQRLQNKFTLGIGGHVRQEDMTSNSIFDWAQREFHEEIAYQGTLTFQMLGILNDDSNAVGQVHIGLLMLLHGSTPHIQIKSELKSGMLMNMAECMLVKDKMESWSHIALEVLANQ